MNVRRFSAANSRDALKRVKEELGADALILSNRPVLGGVEIVALSNEEAREYSQERVAPVQKQAQSAQAPQEHKLHSALHEKIQQSQPQPQRQEPPAKVSEEKLEVESLMNEIKMMRSLLEDQLAGFVWSEMQRRDPLKVAMLRKMLSSGFSPKLSRQIVDKMPPLKEEKQAMEWVRTALSRNLNVSSVETDIIDRGGVFALVGPTGVGKTTTTAKLAARCVVRHGANQLALVTTDTYRIGAHEQLKIYGKILGVQVHSIKDATDLGYILTELKDKHLVLIDTIGMSQKDQKVIDQVAMLNGCDADVERLLLLNATSSGDTLDDVVKAYRGNGLSGCIITKVDEAASLGSALDVIIRNRLMLHYMANGQRVPEDLHPANSQYLIHRAFKAAPENSPHALQELEFPLVMAGEHGLNQVMGA